MGRSKKTANLFEGLENETVQTVDVNYTSIEWLRENTPFFPEGESSAKLNIDREPKIQDGIKIIADLNVDLPEEFLQLGNWWENKTARKELKLLLDEKAKSEGIDPVHYMQKVLRKEVEKLATIQEAINRLLYVTTYFKPREGSKASMKKISIDGVIYEISESVFESLSREYTDKTELREKVKEAANKVVSENVFEL